MPGWVQEGRLPSFTFNLDLSNDFGINQYLWGNMPALDILKMKENEGESDVHRDIALLFAASGDIRNVIKTIIGLPEEYDGHCTVVVNDINFTVIARNIILLLTALILEPEIAVPIMIHIWYSVLIPKSMLAILQEKLLPYIGEVCEKIKDKKPLSIQAKTFTFGNKSLRLLLEQKQWYALKNFFNVPSTFTAEEAQQVRRKIMLAPSRVDYLHRALNNQRPNMRMAMLKFRQDGILLPYGCSRQEFDTPNPYVMDKCIFYCCC
jgi:hypothetical protein